ncbi:response regulator transcription factor [Luteitalea sp. TBR-22]|uniref:response regulator transcription factor n=1 Tax=Luteitalea sp. TBR-22 TaxID=2802971 RepID=UPI001EF46EE3|nr:LuxR C-terminal-related transcriptional regulator [Luteitalea sp. TBR-22]
MSSTRTAAATVALDSSSPFALQPTVFLVEEDDGLREELELLVEVHGWRAETFPSLDAFLANARDAAPACLVIDVPLAGSLGGTLQERLATERQDLPVVWITRHADVPGTVGAMRAGAVSVLLKPVDDDQLLAAIRDGLERSRDRFVRQARTRVLGRRYQSLTRREREVMVLVVAGLLNKQVGAELGISEITVKAHRGKVMRKMRADSLPALVTMADALGLPVPSVDLRSVTDARVRWE